MATKMTAAALGALPKAEFVAAVGGIYECSPWVAERAHSSGPFESLTALHKAMAAAVVVGDRGLCWARVITRGRLDTVTLLRSRAQSSGSSLHHSCSRC